MQPFELGLSNGAKLTGIHNIAPRSTSSPKHRPLVVGIHGGTYECHYFDADPTHTASTSSSAFGIPFISINRPCYGGTSSLLPIPKGSSFPEETGSWLHHHILPTLWSEYGLPNDCNCVILLCHSLGSIGGIVTAAMHGQDRDPLYPLGGIITSGLGDNLLPEMKENPIREPNVPPEHVSYPLDMKDAILFRPETVDPEILKRTEQLNSPTPLAELESLRNDWLPSWRDEWAVNVTAPVMFGQAAQDCFFEGTEDHVRHCVSLFPQSVRVDGSLISKAPHCLELSYWSQGWYARCFGFAMECSASFASST